MKRPGCSCLCALLLALLLLQHCPPQAAAASQSSSSSSDESSSSRRDDPGAPAACGPHRIVVAYEKGQAATARRSLLSHSYRIVQQGHGFFAVRLCPAPQAANTSSSSSSSSWRHHHHQHGSSSSSRSSSGSSPLQLLWGWLSAHCPLRPQGASSSCHRGTSHHKQQQQQLAALAALPGIHTAELDMRRAPLLPASFSPSWQQQQQRQQQRHHHLVPRLLGRWSAAAPQAGAGSSSSATPWQSPPESAYAPWNSYGDDCRRKDLVLPVKPGEPVGEVVPWGIKEVGAWDHDKLQQYGVGRSAITPEATAIVCVIDSGIWKGHEEYKDAAAPGGGTSSSGGGSRDVLSGCSGETCPFPWAEDVVSHGTHVTGTIAAPQNGRGVVGMIPGGAEVHVVRIWNDSGDVSQGQGVFATDLVTAYGDCRSYLRARQAADKSRKFRMVVSMSFGSPGPLTVEKAFMDDTLKSKDILFVASAGNNGSFAADGDWESYPASYEAVISVANANCNSQVEWSSQKNARVDIAAPGNSVLSSVTQKQQTVRASLALSPTTPLRRPVVEATKPPASSGGNGATESGPDGSATAPPYLPGSGSRQARDPSRPEFVEPRPLLNAPLGKTPELPLAVCNISRVMEAALQAMRIGSGGGHRDSRRSGDADTGDGDDPSTARTRAAIDATPGCSGVSGAMCVVELPGQIQEYSEVCYAVLSCVRGGGKGLVLFTRNGDNPRFIFGREILAGLQADCGTRCPCWQVLEPLLKAKSGGQVPPAAVVGAWQGPALTEQLRQGLPVRATVWVFPYAYKHFDGTSMSAPHVAGGAARLWAAYPTCSPAEITAALKGGARRLSDGPNDGGGTGMLDVVAAARLLKQTKGAGGCRG